MRVGSDISGWAARLMFDDRRTLDGLRLVRGVEVAVAGDAIWLRGPALQEADEALSRRLPAVERFDLLADGVLRVPGARVPCTHLPMEAVWSSLQAWIPVELPLAAGPAASFGKSVLRLVRDGAEVPAGAMLLGLDAWVKWAERAPAVRLERLRFAARLPSGTDDTVPAQVLVLGQPLPPLPGLRLISLGDIFIPGGWRWEPAVDAVVVRRLFGLRSDEIALWIEENAPVSIIPAEAIVPASRSAARLTRDSLTVREIDNS